MTVHLVTFSDESMSRSRRVCVDSALRHGVDDYDAVGIEALRDWPVEHGIRLGERGRGYWAWKPLIINDMLTNAVGVDEGDILIYSDVGVEFINNVNYIIERMDQNIFLF